MNAAALSPIDFGACLHLVLGVLPSVGEFLRFGTRRYVCPEATTTESLSCPDCAQTVEETMQADRGPLAVRNKSRMGMPWHLPGSIRPQSGSRNPPGWQCGYHARGQDNPCRACLARCVEQKDFSSRQSKWYLIRSRGPAQHEHQKPPHKRPNIVSSSPPPCCTLFRTRRYVSLRMQSEPTSFRAAHGAPTPQDADM
jgi:hypothetical protein